MRKPTTIDIVALEWFDKVNGNSYFSATITVNYGMKSQKIFNLPFQYGYGNQYQESCFQELKKKGLKTEQSFLWIYCEKNNVILRSTKHENCLKKELNNN